MRRSAASPSEGLHLVSPLAGDAPREAIEQPALRAGLRLEPGLVDVLLRDSEGEPGALPLLSHALVETWKRRDGNVLTVDGYRETGGHPRGGRAVGRPALRQPRPRAARDACARSCCVWSRRRSTATRCAAGCPAASCWATRAVSGSSRCSFARGSSPPRRRRSSWRTRRSRARGRACRSWLDEDVAGQRILRHLGGGRRRVGLARPAAERAVPRRPARRGARVARRRGAGPHRVSSARSSTPPCDEAASASRTLADRARRDARQNRRLRVLLAAAVVLLAVAAAAGIVAFDGRQDARAAQASALHEALVNRSLALRGTNRSVAALLAVEAYRRRPDARAWSALLGTFTADPTFLGYRYLPADHLTGTVVPGTTTAVVALDGRRLMHLDLASGVLDDRFPPPPTTPSRTRCCASATTAASSPSSSRPPIAADASTGAAARHRQPRLRGVLRVRDRHRAARARARRASVRPGRHRDQRGRIARRRRGRLRRGRRRLPHRRRATHRRAPRARPAEGRSTLAARHGGGRLRARRAPLPRLAGRPDPRARPGNARCPADVRRAAALVPQPRRRHARRAARRGRIERARRDRPAQRRQALDGRPPRHPSRSVPVADGRSQVRPALLRQPLRRDRGALPRHRRTHRRRSQPAARARGRPLRDGRRTRARRVRRRGPAVSRWRLDGSGPVTDLVAEGHVASTATTSPAGRCWSLAALRRPPSTPTSPSSRSGTRSPTGRCGRFPKASGMGWIGARHAARLGSGV